MSIENDRKRVIKLREDLSKLKIEYSKEEAKIAPLQKKIIAAKAAIGRTKNNATIKSKLNEIERCNKQIADISKKCGDLQKKIGTKEKELATAEKKFSEAEVKEAKRVERETTRRFMPAAERLRSGRDGARGSGAAQSAQHAGKTAGQRAAARRGRAGAGKARQGRRRRAGAEGL